jgi:hypothetical protein
MVADSEREAAWDALLAVLPTGWYVGRPSYHLKRDKWLLYAFNPSDRAVVGIRSRDWTAIAPTQEGVVREMARCLRELRQGRAPDDCLAYPYPYPRHHRKRGYTKD